jgi:alpha/beta superfamily hydrolase
MQLPSILQGESRTRLLQGIATGAIATIVIGFSWGGWVTGGTAKKMAAASETAGQMSVLVPLCVAQFMVIDGAVTKIKVTESYRHDDVVREFVKTVAGTPMDSNFAQLCANGVDVVLAKAAAKG